MREAFALQKLLTFFQQKYWHTWDINVWNFNETLTNDVVSFEQPGPGILDGFAENCVWKFISSKMLRLHKSECFLYLVYGKLQVGLNLFWPVYVTNRILLKIHKKHIIIFFIYTKLFLYKKRQQTRIYLFQRKAKLMRDVDHKIILVEKNKVNRYTQAGTWRKYDVVYTLMRRRIDVETTSFWHQMPTGTFISEKGQAYQWFWSQNYSCIKKTSTDTQFFISEKGQTNHWCWSGQDHQIRTTVCGSNQVAVVGCGNTRMLCPTTTVSAYRFSKIVNIPLYKDHLRDFTLMVFVNRWSLFTGSNVDISGLCKQVVSIHRWSVLQVWLYWTELRRSFKYNSLSWIRFLFINENICCDPLLEPSLRDGFNEGSQCVFLVRWLVVIALKLLLLLLYCCLTSTVNI